MLTYLFDAGDSQKAWYRCSCGKATLAFRSNVNSGHTTSCGCFRQAVTAARSRTHGHKSGGKRSRAYVVWMNMKHRCKATSGRDFPNYRGRGISYDPAWESFEAFLQDMGEPEQGMTLERIDNGRNYAKDNCRWATRLEQAANKRNNVRYTWNGKTLTLPEWERETGIQRMTIYKRLQRGWELGRALTEAPAY